MRINGFVQLKLNARRELREMHAVWKNEPISSGLITHLAGDANNMGSFNKVSLTIRPRGKAAGRHAL
jgi:hypothetical protein